jgi:heparanase 1
MLISRMLVLAPVLVLGATACRSRASTADPDPPSDKPVGQHSHSSSKEAQVETLAPASMRRVGAIEDRFQSYNVEMLEVTGGKFWKPYGPELDALLQNGRPTAATSGSDTPPGMNPALYEYRPPIDLTNVRLRKLAAALGPAYVRVSGTWANSTYFPDADEAPTRPPEGFGGVLTRQQWRGVVDFARSVDARIVTSFATSAGTRDRHGIWTPAQALRLLDYTTSVGGSIAAAEYMNEPNLAAMGSAPAGYDAAAYGRDFKVFRAFATKAAPTMTLLGPGSVGETGGAGDLTMGMEGTLKTRDLMIASGPGVDAVSYHHYGTASKRCASTGMAMTTAEDALTEEWLARTDATLAFYKSLRDELEPGAPIWLTETADAACGGNPWGSWFLDTFRYLDQAARLAKQGVVVVAHNTLAASDYGLLDENTLEPKPNYWGALLWRRLMGITVLESGLPRRAGLHVYAHCLRGTPGGVALLVLNTDKVKATTLTIPVKARRYTMHGDLESRQVQLNGATLTLGPHDEMPSLEGVASPAGETMFAPATITFLALPDAGNTDCR